MSDTERAALDIAREISLEGQRDDLRAQLEAVTRERDEARAFAADREGLALELEAARETIQHGIELRKQVERERDVARESEARMRAALARAALSAPAPEPSGPDYSGLCSAPECGGHCGYVHGRGCEAIREYLAEHGGDPYRAPTREPSERMMRVAEAVREACVNAFCVPLWEQRTPEATLRAIDLRAIVAKVTP